VVEPQVINYITNKATEHTAVINYSQNRSTLMLGTVKTVVYVVWFQVGTATSTKMAVF